MKIKQEIAEAVESLIHHKLRTVLTLLGMIFGVGAVIAMLSIGRGAEREALQLIDFMGLRNIIVKAKVFEETKLKEIRENSPGLTLQDLNAARETLPFLSAYSASKQVKVYAMFSNAAEIDADVLGVLPTHLEMTNLTMNSGRFLLPIDDLGYAHVCVIGSRVAQVLFPGRDAVGERLKVNHVWLKVVGVLKDKNLVRNEFQGVPLKGEQNNVYIPLQTALKAFRFGVYESQIDDFRLQIKKGIPCSAAAATLAQLLKKRHKEIDDYEMIVPEALLEQHRQTQSIFTIVMAFIAGISLLVGGIGIMNIMLATVLERTREIGLRRAIGARKRDIKRQFLIETITISTLGGIMGILFGFILSLVIAAITGWAVGWTIGAVLLSFCVCALIGLVSGSYPAMQASRLDPIEALRHD